MPPRSNPTARQARLGAELRKLREAAGLSTTEAGALLGGNQAQISHIEAGRWGVSAARVRQLAVHYEASHGELLDALCAMAEERGKQWWDEYRGVLAPGFLDVAELEYRAASLRSLQTVTLPGILQTEDYVRAIYGGHIPVLPADEVELRVEFRTRRQQIFARADPPSFEAFIHEAALRMRFGGGKVTRAQLSHLRAASEWPSVKVRVIPFANEEFIEATQPVLYAGGPVSELDTARVSGALGGHSLGTDAGLKKYRTLFAVADRTALGVKASRQLIHDIEKEL
ncbi:helix-turn-helix domain-containing protein [Streptomyces kanamyceticus]|uniref:XRE family transcriptional regulator n=1 Tax=Streptomyces kanamyceticus TaxID=1967 RepID=A0A5J6GD87_STRKN|nr:helix-turn-helix transcriptional regulator [Streptomyces kanamyceticus]QEU93529.1 XRE family transcriptional regulator [Streptomyces kanamyceticus]